MFLSSINVTKIKTRNYEERLYGDIHYIINLFCENVLKERYHSLDCELHLYIYIYIDWLLAGRSGDRIPVGARFFAHVQTGPEAHPASCTMGTRSFPGVKRPGRGADHSPPSSAEVKKE
jgi:hypothetical protein